jgi:hypothetical protein
MSDSEDRETARVQSRDQRVREFLAEAARDIERMRAAVVAAAGEPDSTSWRRFENVAHNLGARAGALQLGVLQMCARELEQFVMAKSMDGVMVAVETISLELNALTSDLAER